MLAQQRRSSDLNLRGGGFEWHAGYLYRTTLRVGYGPEKISFHMGREMKQLFQAGHQAKRHAPLLGFMKQFFCSFIFKCLAKYGS